MYSPERSIADAFRMRGDQGYELVRDALREWLRCNKFGGRGRYRTADRWCVKPELYH
jgi:hypothetical protein